MKYLVITAKHHEGFSMWPTAVQSFKDVNQQKLYSLQEFTQFGSRDILMELKNACDAAGIKFCLYYSILDWNHSSQTLEGSYSRMASESARVDYIADMTAQLRELITTYHPHILWFDGDWTYNSGAPTLSKWWTENDGLALYNYLMDIDPDLIINERVFREVGLGDYECPEQSIPASPRTRPWETCQTMNNSWGYNAQDTWYKPTETIIQQLVDVASKDGNYLLNIGPMGSGNITTEEVSRLTEIGSWMDIYGSSIYNTTRSPYNITPSWGRFTKREGKLFVHVFDWPTDGILRIPELNNTISKISLLNSPSTSLTYTQSGGYYLVDVPITEPNAINSVIVLDVVGVPSASSKVTSIVVKGASGQTNIPSIGGTLQMTAVVSPQDAVNKVVTWSTSDSEVASINSSGLLTAKKKGTVTVIATSDDNSGVTGQLIIQIGSASTVRNLLLNTDFETQGAWKVTQCDPSGSITAVFGKTGDSPLAGSGKFLELTTSGAFSAEVFVYQRIQIEKGQTYKFSAAMKDVSPSLTDDWVSIAYTNDAPVENQKISETIIASFGSWKSCTGVGFDGLMETSCAAVSTSFTIPADFPSDFIYFGINVGTWSSNANVKLLFDDVMLTTPSTDVITSTDETPDPGTTVDLQVFPNPVTNGQLIITNEDLTFGEAKFNLIDAFGNTRRSGSFTNTMSLNVMDIPNGLYFLGVENKRSFRVKKIVIQQ